MQNTDPDHEPKFEPPNSTLLKGIDKRVRIPSKRVAKLEHKLVQKQDLKVKQQKINVKISDSKIEHAHPNLTT